MAPSRCPGCGHGGRGVDRITLKALLKPRVLPVLGPGQYRFCPVSNCPVVYFGQGEPFLRQDVLVPVFQKETARQRTVCYCFDVSEEQIAREVEASGVSATAERIKGLVEASRCACEVRNPQGGCCLGSVMVIVNGAVTRIPGEASGRT